MTSLSIFLTETDWAVVLADIIKTDYFEKLLQDVNFEYNSTTCYPPKYQIFNAFQYCKFADLKVVILGQDPYHGAGEANGLAFSVNDGVKMPPSLRNIFKEISSDLNQTMLPTSGNLDRWAKQGVLLLNSTLTVKENQANSHKNIGWQQFTDAVISEISDQKSNVVFLLWGNFALKKAKLIDVKKHLILVSGHPSPMSANQGKWFGNNHFSKTNQFLALHNKTSIEW